jgi:hypothetical protein
MKLYVAAMMILCFIGAGNSPTHTSQGRVMFFLCGALGVWGLLVLLRSAVTPCP